MVKEVPRPKVNQAGERKSPTSLPFWSQVGVSCVFPLSIAVHDHRFRCHCQLTI